MILRKITAYRADVSVNEYSTTTIGYYSKKAFALEAGKGKGWYGEDGKAELEEVYQDENGDLYEVEKLGRLKDEDQGHVLELMNKIKSKLTPEELDILGLC